MTTVVPFPRGLAVVDGKMYVLARGRVRGAGGVHAEIEDQAGTIYEIDPDVAEPTERSILGQAVQQNGKIFAKPTEPPFQLWDRTADPPEKDRLTDRPYCTLRYHEPTKSFYICAFGGIDKPRKPGKVSFSKNLTDGLLRYDLRTGHWYEIERHNIEAGGNYPHHNPRYAAPPHGWLNGPDNCLPLGRWLYAVAKENSVLVRYDLSALIADPEAGPPPSEVVFNESVQVRSRGIQKYHGHSALAYHDRWLYIGYRTSSRIIRFRLDDNHDPVQPIEAELIAQFDPHDPRTGQSANITDMGFDPDGRLYVISAEPARIYRITPDANKVFDGRKGRRDPWTDLAVLTNNLKMKGENVLHHDGYLYATSGDGYAYQEGAAGTVYRIKVTD